METELQIYIINNNLNILLLLEKKHDYVKHNCVISAALYSGDKCRHDKELN